AVLVRHHQHPEHDHRELAEDHPGEADERGVEGEPVPLAEVVELALRQRRDQHAQSDGDDHRQGERPHRGRHGPDLRPLGADDLSCRHDQPFFFQSSPHCCCCCCCWAGAGGPECAWYSTDSAVSCMKASSRDACCGLSSCSTIWCRAASSPICSALLPSTSRTPLPLSTAVIPASWNASRSCSRCGLRTRT